MTAQGDDADWVVLLSLGIMFAGLLVITAAACWEHRTGKTNFIMRWLWRQ
jgi:hypothetical protein